MTLHERSHNCTHRANFSLTCDAFDRLLDRSHRKALRRPSRAACRCDERTVQAVKRAEKKRESDQ